MTRAARLGRTAATTVPAVPVPRWALIICLCGLGLTAACSSKSDAHHQGSGSGDRSAVAAARVKDSAMHARHAGAKPAIGCEGCHELVQGQYLRAKSWQCKQCHSDAPLALHAAAPPDSEARECWTCHDFESRDDHATPCTTCHDQTQGSVRAIAAHDPDKPDDCSTCHRAHQQPSLAATACESCHKEPVSGHDKPDIPITGCASCHAYHEPAEVASERCMNCHRQSRARVPTTATFADGHVKCVSCHRQHKFFKREVLPCRDECHQNQVALAETKVEKHACLGCHNNHDVRGKNDAAEAPEAACEQCHARKINPKHPKDKATKTKCVGCHKPHAGRGTPLAVACSSCHKAASTDRGFHQGSKHRGPECRNCHKPHDFALAGSDVTLCKGCHGDRPFRNAKTIKPYEKHADCFKCHGDTVRHQPAGPRAECTSCHTEKAAVIRKGHTKCVGCHDPHTTKQQNPCAKCHADEAGRARKDHRNCINCHEPHSGTQKKPCGGCHQAEAASAPEKHQTCTNCHDQHSTLVKKPCADCHKDRATGVHAPVKGGCLNCHRPHGPDGHASPPRCTTCHTSLPLLHQAPHHKECTNCHRSHGEQPYKQRATCLKCHVDRKNHEPTAPLCNGCHAFGGGQ